MQYKPLNTADGVPSTSTSSRPPAPPARSDSSACSGTHLEGTGPVHWTSSVERPPPHRDPAGSLPDRHPSIPDRRHHHSPPGSPAEGSATRRQITTLESRNDGNTNRFEPADCGVPASHPSVSSRTSRLGLDSSRVTLLRPGKTSRVAVSEYQPAGAPPPSPRPLKLTHIRRPLQISTALPWCACLFHSLSRSRLPRVVPHPFTSITPQSQYGTLKTLRRKVGHRHRRLTR